MLIDKVITLLPNRFPTEKAYGVTIRETMLAALSLGFEAEVWCTSDRLSSQEKLTIKRISPNFRNSRFQLFEKFSFQWNRYRFIVRSLKKLPNSGSLLIWTRDPILGICARILRNKLNICVELHHPPSDLDTVIFRALRCIPNVDWSNFKILTLTNGLAQDLDDCYVFFLGGLIHMAAPDDFFESTKPKKENDEILLGYVGKASSSGHDNELGKLIELFKVEAEKLPDLRLVLLGIEDTHIEELLSLAGRKLVDSKRVVVKGHLSRSEVLMNLQQIDIGIVPYASSKYNDFRFPIKIVEYAATGCAMLLNDTPHLREIVGNFATYFDLSSPESLHDALSSLISDRATLMSSQINSRLWADGFTYGKRVEKALGLFES